MKTNFFDSSCCTGPDRCEAGCSPKLERSAQNPGFFVSGGQVFLSSFLGSLSRRVDSSSQEHRTAQCSLRVSRSLQPRGRWARSGKNAFGRAGAGSSGASRFNEREQFACEAVLSGSPDRHFEEQRALGGRWQFSGSQCLAGAGCDAPLDGAPPAVPIELAGQDHVAGCAGR